MKKIKGFTLIELLIVIAIIGILLSILLPQCSKYKKSIEEKKKQIEIVKPVEPPEILNKDDELKNKLESDEMKSL